MTKYRSFPLGNAGRSGSGATRGPAKAKIAREEAEGLAIAALNFVASDAERLEFFLSLTGLTPTNLREIAVQPSFLAAVLDHLADHEPLLIAFCEGHGCDPLTMMQARRVLGGDSNWDST